MAIIGALAREWGVREELHDIARGMQQPDSEPGREPDRGVTVWVVLAGDGGIGEGLADSLALDLAAVEELH